MKSPQNFAWQATVTTAGILLLAWWIPSAVLAQQETVDVQAVIRESFLATHEGWSADEVVLNKELNSIFVARCQSQLPDAVPADLNWRLLNMRKAGKLQSRTTRSGQRPSTEHFSVAEMVARSMIDHHKVTIDRMMTDPVLRTEFDSRTLAIGEKLDPYLVRKAAVGLRKQRRLRPELITRIADWGRSIHEFPLKTVEENPEVIPHQPGIYIFRNPKGYLYIGQSINLNQRLTAHLDDSSSFALAKFLAEESAEEVKIEIHVFPSDSRGSETMIRRAYESELIESRQPKFNIQP